MLTNGGIAVNTDPYYVASPVLCKCLESIESKEISAILNSEGTNSLKYYFLSPYIYQSGILNR